MSAAPTEYMQGLAHASVVVHKLGIDFARQWRHAIAIDPLTPHDYVLGVCDRLDEMGHDDARETVTT